MPPKRTRYVTQTSIRKSGGTLGRKAYSVDGTEHSQPFRNRHVDIFKRYDEMEVREAAGARSEEATWGAATNKNVSPSNWTRKPRSC